MVERVTIIGSGNWGSAIARIIGANVCKFPSVFDEPVRMWVYEETLPDGRLLSAVINGEHENVKYLPGIRLPPNIVAVPDLAESVAGSTMLVFVTPHQFVRGICAQIRGLVRPDAKAISLIKGVDLLSTHCNDDDDNNNNRGSEGIGRRPLGNIQLVSEIIRNDLALQEVCVLMGANIANEVAQEQFCESTLGYAHDLETAKLWKQLLEAAYFRIRLVRDIVGVELCGALKNVVALGAGFVDGLGYGENTKAAVVRIGLGEMRRFCQMCHEHVQTETFWESCGVADLITTCYGGRNRRIAEALVRTGRALADLELELLNGQKLQGPPAAKEVYDVIRCQGRLSDFPLMVAVYRICFERAPPLGLIEALSQSP